MLTIHKSKTETEIIEGCLSGKSWAQRSLYDRVSAKMLAVCVRYIQDRNEAEHVMIGGMVKVFEKVSQYSGEGHFEGWIRRIMVNESLMYIRKNKNMSIESEIEDDQHEALHLDWANQLEAEDLLRLIQSLPIGYQTVFNLYAIEGYNHAEIGKHLGISENTSKSQLSRARKLLQQKLVSLEQKELTKHQEHGK